jgi:hypothetical protein
MVFITLSKLSTELGVLGETETPVGPVRCVTSSAPKSRQSKLFRLSDVTRGPSCLAANILSKGMNEMGIVKGHASELTDNYELKCVW